MNDLMGTALHGPTYRALTGERRQAFRRQRTITAAIFLLALAAITFAAFNGASTEEFTRFGGKVLVATAVLSVLQFLYALARRETVWQLRVREWRSNSQKSTANKAGLLEFATKLQERKK